MRNILTNLANRASGRGLVGGRERGSTPLPKLCEFADRQIAKEIIRVAPIGHALFFPPLGQVFMENLWGCLIQFLVVFSSVSYQLLLISMGLQFFWRKLLTNIPIFVWK